MCITFFKFSRLLENPATLYIIFDMSVDFVTLFNIFRQHWFFPNDVPHIFTIFSTFSLFWAYFLIFHHHYDTLRYLWHVQYSCSRFLTHFNIYLSSKRQSLTLQIIHYLCSAYYPLLCICPFYTKLPGFIVYINVYIEHILNPP